jgi:hypothetical protein
MTIVNTFKNHIQSVEKLMTFDDDVLSIAISNIEALEAKLKNHHKFDNPHISAQTTLTQLRGFRTNKSLQPRYETIFNQALVLLVSYFGSSVSDLFKLGISKTLAKDTESPLNKEQIKITFRELQENDFQLREIAPELLIQAKDISFQDMQSINRAFKDHLGITIERTDTVNDIILAQNCRHIIVHTGAHIDARLIKQLTNANPRSLKKNLTIGDKVQFTIEDVNIAANAMLKYIENISKEINKL